MLGFQEKLILADGSVIFYHQAILVTGEQFYFLSLVKGKNIQAYFDFIAHNNIFSISEINNYATLIQYGIGHLTEADINQILKNIKYEQFKFS